MEHGEIRHDIADRVFPQLPAAASMDLDQRFDLNNSPIGNDQVDDFDSTSHSYIDEEFLPEMEGFDGFEVVPHSYVPGVISGLDEFSSLPEFTDIG